MAVDVQTFTPGSALWTKPANALWVEMFAIGGGGMGGAGHVMAAGNNRFGGGGGGSAGWSRALYLAADLPATLAVTCGYGGGTSGAVEQRARPNSSPPLTDPGGYTLGMAFTPNANGIVTHLRYYREGQAAHVLSLWTIGGVKLATVTDAASAAAGWREVALATPVNVFGGDQYVVSYTSNAVAYRYGGTMGASTAPNLGSLQAYYATGTAEAFPTTSATTNDYNADVVFKVCDWGYPSWVGANQDSAWCYAGGGANGSNGSNVSGLAGGAATVGEYVGGAGAAGTTATPAQPPGSKTGPGGGGGGVTSGNVASAGGTAGGTLNGWGRAAIPGGAVGAAGTNGAALGTAGGMGGGGGGASSSAAGGKGGDGGVPGGGGGGGGAGVTARGIGGDGGAGRVYIVTWCS